MTDFVDKGMTDFVDKGMTDFDIILHPDIWMIF